MKAKGIKINGQTVEFSEDTNVYIVDYANPNWEEAKAALIAGKALLMMKDKKVFSYVSSDADYDNMIFTAIYFGSGDNAVLDKTNNWLNTTTSYELSTRKEQTLSPKSTNTYPSSKAVADYISEQNFVKPSALDEKQNKLNNYTENKDQSVINCDYFEVNTTSNVNIVSYAVAIEAGEDGIHLNSNLVDIGNSENESQINISGELATSTITSKQILINGKQAVTVDDVLKEWVGTQEEFDALTEFDEKTTYYIV